MNNIGKPWTEREESLLGKMTDRDLAKQLGRTEHAVCVKRLSMGITPFVTRYKRKQLPLRIKRLIGKLPDAEVAKLAGVTRQFIHRKRKLDNRKI